MKPMPEPLCRVLHRLYRALSLVLNLLTVPLAVLFYLDRRHTLSGGSRIALICLLGAVVLGTGLTLILRRQVLGHIALQIASAGFLVANLIFFLFISRGLPPGSASYVSMASPILLSWIAWVIARVSAPQQAGTAKKD